MAINRSQSRSCRLVKPTEARDDGVDNVVFMIVVLKFETVCLQADVVVYFVQLKMLPLILKC